MVFLLKIVPAGVKKSLITKWYRKIAEWDRDGTLSFLNYGYTKTDDTKKDSADVFSNNLYTEVAGQTNLAGKNVLEVGCGFGAGAYNLAKSVAPKSYTGVDLNPKAIIIARKRYADNERLQFRTGDAENLPLPSHEFDAVINVESSHNYPHIDKFFSEVHRVLKPKGFLLLADFRRSENIDSMVQRIEAAGFHIERKEMITANVVRSLELGLDDREKKAGYVRKQIPFWIRPFTKGLVREFAKLKGSHGFHAFKNGTLAYICIAAQK